MKTLGKFCLALVFAFVVMTGASSSANAQYCEYPGDTTIAGRVVVAYGSKENIRGAQINVDFYQFGVAGKVRTVATDANGYFWATGFAPCTGHLVEPNTDGTSYVGQYPISISVYTGDGNPPPHWLKFTVYPY